MYLRELTLQNIRCFHNLHLTFPEVRKDGNWCVILGENGVGKSTILRAIALAMMSDRSAARLLPNPAAFSIDPSTGVIAPAAGLTPFRTRRARETISCFKLKRTGLNLARKKVARRVRAALAAYAVLPGEPTRQILKELIRTDEPFRAVVRQMLRYPEPALAAAVHTALADPEINTYAREENMI